MKLVTEIITRPTGVEYHIYRLISSHGLTVSLLDFGATIQNVSVEEENGQIIPLALGSPEIPFYENLTGYAGASLAPVAGRIRRGHLPIDGTDYTVIPNEGTNQLHGGPHNLSGVIWKTEAAECTEDTASVVFTAEQADGLDGYPGNRRYEARYTLTEDHRLTVTYRAWTDKPTFVNLSNHSYWNVTGDFTAPALGQEMTVFANQVCLTDNENLPVEIISVDGTAFDFRNGRIVSEALNAETNPALCNQLEKAKGLDHAFLLDSTSEPDLNGLKPAAILKDTASGRTLTVSTDAPSIVVYSGGFLPDGEQLHGGQNSCASCAIALEAQMLPDMMHLRPEDCKLLRPGETFLRTISFHLHK